MTGPLIDVHALRHELAGDDPPVLLDVRWALGGPDGASEYAAGHLPGAVYVDLDTQLSRPRRAGEGRHPLPDPVALQEVLRDAGVRTGSRVVVYDAAASTSAARGWWVLRWAGLQDVRVLDGGLAAWTAAGFDVSTDVPLPDPGDVEVAPARCRSWTPPRSPTWRAPAWCSTPGRPSATAVTSNPWTPWPGTSPAR